jgi:soluble lytic murein transglycosylase-like protein
MSTGRRLRVLGLRVLGLRVLGLTAAAVAVVLTAGCGLLGGGGDQNGVAYAASDDTAASATDEPTPDDTAAETTPVPSPTTRKPATRPAPRTTSATPTADPNNFQLPACAHYSGKSVTKAQAKSALTAAAAKIYWPKSAPKLKVSADLVKSVAWQESGWQSNIVNCDGGLGLMQISSGTTDHINSEFVQTYDPTSYRENAVIGANYLAWLTKYFGDAYFQHSYDLSTAKCKSSSLCLLNLVISGYNAGFGAVDIARLGKKLPNPAYVDSVRSLMTSCYCDRY